MSMSLKLADNELFALMKLKRAVEDVLQPQHDDQYLIRWLRARKWDPAAAEKMIRDSFEWRKQWEVDNIDEWQPPQGMENYLPHGLSGFDKDGAPVIISIFGGLDVCGLLHMTSRRDMIKITIKNLENYMKISREQVRKHGLVAGQLTVIFDMEGFNLKQYMWRPAGEVILALIQMYEANYPEILKTCYIINAPRVFTFAFSVAKKFMHEYTLSKIKIYNTDSAKWQLALSNIIQKDQLPAHYGGILKDPNGNPRLITKICQGGKVPKEMYIKEKDKDKNTDYTTVVIRKGDKLEFDVPAPDVGSYLSWEFRSEDHDIKFGILRKDAKGGKTEVIPLRRVAAHQLDEIGILTCEAPATYSVIFDNRYSLLRNKKIHYSVRVIPPTNELETLTPTTI